MLEGSAAGIWAALAVDDVQRLLHKVGLVQHDVLDVIMCRKVLQQEHGLLLLLMLSSATHDKRHHLLHKDGVMQHDDHAQKAC